jgi:hypothetical protein
MTGNATVPKGAIVVGAAASRLFGGGVADGVVEAAATELEGTAVTELEGTAVAVAELAATSGEGGGALLASALPASPTAASRTASTAADRRLQAAPIVVRRVVMIGPPPLSGALPIAGAPAPLRP